MQHSAVAVAAAFPVAWLWATVVFFPLLPDFVAVLGAATLAFVVPGTALLALTRRSWTVTETIALGFALGMCQVALFAVPALFLHLTLAWVVVPHVLATSVAIYLWKSRGGYQITVSRGEVVVVTGVLVAGLLAAALLHGEVYRNQDNWRALAYTASYARGEGINAEDPNLGAGLPVQARVLFRTQSIDAALLADFADADVVEVALDHFSTVASMFSFLLVFAMASRLSGSQRAGFYALLIYAAFAVIDTYFPHTYGRGIFLRAGEDKMLAPFVLLPGLILFALTVRPKIVDAVLLGLLTLGLTLMHPFGIAFAGLALAPLVGTGLIKRTKEAIQTAWIAIAALAIPALLAVYQRFGANDSGEVLWGEDEVAQDLGMNLPAGLIMLDPRHPIHPLIWIAVAAGVFLALRAKSTRMRLTLLSLSVAVPFALFFPLTATVVGALATQGLLWRFLLAIPAAAILGMFIGRTFTRLGLQVACLVAMVAVAMGLQEGIARTGYYLGGVPPDDFTVAASLGRLGDGRAPRLDAYNLSEPRVEAFVDEIDQAINGDGLVLVPRVTILGEKAVFIDYAIPIYSDDIKSYSKGSRHRDFPGLWSEGEIYESLEQAGRDGVTKRSHFRDIFYADEFPPMVPQEALFEEKPITHVVVPVAYVNLTYRLDQDPLFRRLGSLRNGEFLLFEVLGTDDSRASD